MEITLNIMYFFSHVNIHRLSLCPAMQTGASETCAAMWLLMTCRAPVY